MKELVQLQSRLSEFRARGTRLWVVSAETPEELLSLRDRVPGMVLVADSDYLMIDAFGVRHQGGRGSRGDCAYPTTVLVDPEGRVRWIHRPARLVERAGPDLLLDAVDDMLRSP